MSWLFSQALVEEYSVDTSSDGEQSAPLSGNPTQQAYCAPDKMMDFSRLSRFGMTFRPLTESLGQELLTLYLAAFHAKTFQSQEVELDLMENDQECGEKWQGLLARFDPDSHLWRTAQCSLLEDLNESLQTLPQWGTTVGGELYLLPMWVQCTNVNESGLSLNSPPPAKVAYTNSLRWTGRNNATLETDKTIRSSSPISFETSIEGLDRDTWKTEPDICRVVDGMAAKLDNSNAIKDRLKAIGNGQVPLCAATAWRILTER